MSSNAIPKAFGEVRVTSSLFEAGLKCFTKCFLLSLGEQESGNAYADWARSHDESYQKEAIQRLIEGTEMADVTGVTDATNLSSAGWRLAVIVRVHAHNLESIIPLVERMKGEQHRPAQLVPVRFVCANKLTSHHKLLVA